MKWTKIHLFMASKAKLPQQPQRRRSKRLLLQLDGLSTFHDGNASFSGHRSKLTIFVGVTFTLSGLTSTLERQCFDIEAAKEAAQWRASFEQLLHKKFEELVAPCDMTVQA